MSGFDGERVLLDCRWYGTGGVGRFTEHLVRGLGRHPAAGRWLLWGDDPLCTAAWEGAEHVPSRRSPRALAGQREFPGPRSSQASLAFFPHHIRPLWPLAPCEVTAVHDTIPLRFGSPVARRAARIFMLRVARHSTLIVTVSNHSRQSIHRELGVPLDRILIVPQPIDHAAAARVRAARASTQPSGRAVYVGRATAHKNLDRLVRGFARSDLANSGGTLTLVGLGEADAAPLRSLATDLGVCLESLGIVSQPCLEAIMTTCSVLVQPSLDEGYGLPVAEALAAGVPVAASHAGAIAEVVAGAVPTFDPLSIDSIGQAIDDAPTQRPVEREWPTPDDLARAVVRVVETARRRHGANKAIGRRRL